MEAMRLRGKVLRGDHRRSRTRQTFIKRDETHEGVLTFVKSRVSHVISSMNVRLVHDPEAL